MELPLFPLNSVLFPGATLALHIFEERHQRMIRWCLQNGSPFGVLLVRSGNKAAFRQVVTEIRATHRSKRNLMKMLDGKRW